MDSIEKSDYGSQAQQLLSSIELKLLTRRLNKKDQRIVKMLMAGYKQKEVIQKLKTNYPYIARLRKRLMRMIIC
jgi:hypothetical protein